MLVFTDAYKQEQVGHDLQLGGAELLAKLPVGQGPFELEASEPGDDDPGLDDGEDADEQCPALASSSVQDSWFFFLRSAVRSNPLPTGDSP